MLRSVAYVGLGLVLGVATLYIVLSMQEAQPENPPSDTTAAPSELGQRLERLEEAIRDLNRSITLLKDSGSAEARAWPSIPAPRDVCSPTADEAETSTREAVPVPVEIASHGWTTVIDPSLAGVLVEHGLTPFDGGVGQILPEAARQMREAIAVRERQMEERRQHYSDVTSTSDLRYPEWKQAGEVIQRAHKQRIEQLLESFRERVCELPQD